MIWIIGEYAERIDNADELLETFLETFPEETSMVRCLGPGRVTLLLRTEHAVVRSGHLGGALRVYLISHKPACVCLAWHRQQCLPGAAPGVGRVLTTVRLLLRHRCSCSC
jgi:hypothetical protein